MGPVPSITVADLPADAFLLDVRERGEWDAGHASTAAHLPMSELPARVREVPHADPLYVVCRSGARSARVVAFLAEQGVAAVNVEGGMQAWAGAGRAMSAAGDRTPEVI